MLLCRLTILKLKSLLVQGKKFSAIMHLVLPQGCTVCRPDENPDQ